ncbi:MAG: tRNA uridine-5-carboxymethylaminomethyl(34) synthesis GTPase MnmE [Clostridia bacterium]|nr:tRNA uridine-5-carboxymethylaminomethyl(34) synthesis GTPase MnmE [Clostridia bacterium]
MEEKTIAAISTPMGVGGISIVRLSGSDSLNIANSVFTFRSKKTNIKNCEPRKMYLGSFKIGENEEECLMVYFKAPYSYTGEDLIEFQCHGGVVVTKKILETLLDNGATLASGGEFTKRAFLNGKLSLDEAEGVIDVINAESESELKAGYNLLKGNLNHEVVTIQNDIKDSLSKIEVALDYPEEDLEEETRIDIGATLHSVLDRLNKMLDTASTGRKIKDGTKVAIVGKPNAGKSSIMNALLNFERAIVTDIQGTTRDTLEETYIYKGVKFILIDTAGIRDTEDVVEKIGVKKAKDTIKSADVTLYIVDGSRELNEDDFNIINTLDDKNTIVIVNKSDLQQKVDENKVPFKNKISVSAISKNGIEKIKEKIFNFVIDENILSSDIIITNVRHLNSIKDAIKNVQESLSALEQNIGLDLVTVNIKNVWLALGEITGETDNEKIIDNIFAKFCVGK